MLFTWPVGVDLTPARTCSPRGLLAWALPNPLRMACIGVQTAGGVTEFLDAIALEVAPLSHTPPNALKAYAALVTRLKKPLQPLLGNDRDPGHSYAYLPRRLRVLI